MRAFIKKNKKHIIYISILVLILFIHLSALFINFNSFHRGDLIASYSKKAYVLKESVKKYHDFLPLWNPYEFGGFPFFANALNTLLHYTFPLIIPNVLASLKMIMFFSILVGGIFMYALIFYLLKDHESAFIAALIYMVNPWINWRIALGHITTIGGYTYVPIIILFTFKALRSKEWFYYSIITGILFAFQILSGSDLKATFWTAPIFLFALLSHLIGKNLTKRTAKIITIGLIVSLTCFALIAVKSLPSYEFLKMSSRSEVAFESTLAGKVENFKQIFPKLIEQTEGGFPNIRYHLGGFHIGLISSLLVLLAIATRYKNKNVLFFSAVLIFFIFIVTGSFVWYFMWKYIPLYKSFRYLHRTPLIFMFAGAALAAYGFHEIKRRLTSKGWSKKKAYIAFIAVAALIIMNLMVFGPSPYREGEWADPAELLKSNYLLQNLSKEPGIFRIHVYEQNGIDWNTEFQSIPLGLSQLYSYDGLWLVEYMNVYLSVAYNDPAKFWGMLNTKFITSTEEINISGLKFYNKFKNCTICWPWVEGWRKAWGPYLYINEKFMPRAYVINNAVLVVGEKESSKQLIYGLMIQKEFDPKNMIFVLGKQKIDDYSLNELKDYKAIILGKDSIDQNSIFKLEQYTKEGGILLPDITKGENQVSEENIVELWKLQGNYSPIEDKDIIMVDFDNRKINLPGKDGFLMLSEQFSMYPGWRASVNKQKREILRANGVLSAVRINKEDSILLLKYNPTSFIIGSSITITAIILLLSYFTLRYMKTRRSKANKSSDNTLSQA